MKEWRPVSLDGKGQRRIPNQDEIQTQFIVMVGMLLAEPIGGQVSAVACAPKTGFMQLASDHSRVTIAIGYRAKLF